MEENLLKERKQILMDIMKSKEYQPMKVKELAMVLNVPKEDREELRYVLNELMNEGKIVEPRKENFPCFCTDSDPVLLRETERDLGLLPSRERMKISSFRNDASMGQSIKTLCRSHCGRTKNGINMENPEAAGARKVRL